MLGKQWRYYVGLLGLLLGLNACVTEDLHNPITEGQGYLRLELASVVTELSLSSQTKASTVSIPSKDIPTASDFVIDIQKGGVSADGFPKTYSELSGSSLVLPTGDYTVSAAYGENALIQATPYFFGSSNVTVLPNQQVTATIEAALANALLIPSVDENLRKHYSTWALTLKVGGESMRLASNENSDNHLYVKAGQLVTGIFNGKNLAEKETSTEWTVISETASCTQYTIQCNPDLSVFSNIQLTATATHTTDANGYLNGTDVTLNLDPQSAPIELIDSWDIKMLYDGVVIRTYSNKPDNATMDVTEGWPYVPQSSTLLASIHLRTGEDIILSPTFELPKPVFEAVIASANTSYSVYLSSGASEANTKDGSSIFDITAAVSISSDILNNENYSKLPVKVTYTTDGGGNSGELPYGTVGQLTALAWQKYLLTASIAFDGETVSSSPIDCHVTGLPYKATPPSNKLGGHSWTEDQTNWGVEYFNWGDSQIEMYVDNLTGSYIRIGSPIFHIPKNTIDIYVYMSAHGYYKKGWLSDTKNDVNTTVYVTNNLYKSISVAHNYGNYPDSEYLISDLSLDSSVAKIQIENSKLGGSYRLYIRSVRIEYR